MSAKKYVCDQAKIECQMCTNTQGTLMVTSNMIKLQGKLWATEKDKEKVNLLFQGTCKASPQQSVPCIAVIQTGNWQGVGDVLVQNNKALLESSTIMCNYGGSQIKIKDDLQKSQPSSLVPTAVDGITPDEPVSKLLVFSSLEKHTGKQAQVTSQATIEKNEFEISEHCRISNVWSWPNPRMPYNSVKRAVGIERIANTGVTDIVLHLNSISNNVASGFQFLDNRSRRSVIRGIRTTITALANEGLHPNIHLMVFPRPNVRYMRVAINEILPILREFRIKSLLLDAEGNWRGTRDQLRINSRVTRNHIGAAQYINDHLKPELGSTLLGFTDDMVTERGRVLANICDYVMPQAYSTNDHPLTNRYPREMQTRRYGYFETFSKPMIFALAAWDLLRPRNYPNATEYETMMYTLNTLIKLYNPTQVAYWSLPAMGGNIEIERFLKDLSEMKH